MHGPSLRAAGASCLLLASAILIGAAPQAQEPGVTFLNFKGGVYAGGSRHYVLWSTRGIARTALVSIELSRDRGSEWETVAKGLPNTGRYLWDLPREDGTSRLLRITLAHGDRRISAISAGGFGIDTEVPDIQPYCQVRGEKTCDVEGNKAEIRFDLPVDAGPAPVKSIEIWVTTDDGISWHRAALGEPSDRSIPIPLAKGETGVILVAQDAAGNRDDTPLAGSKPELRILAKGGKPAPPPDFAGIETGKTYRGGDPITLQWNPPEEFKGWPARIEIWSGNDEEWHLLRGDLPWKGTAKIPVPALNSPKTRLRVTLVPSKKGDDPWSAELGPFRIETPSPTGRIKKVEEDK